MVFNISSHPVTGTWGIKSAEHLYSLQSWSIWNQATTCVGTCCVCSGTLARIHSIISLPQSVWNINKSYLTWLNHSQAKHVISLVRISMKLELGNIGTSHRTVRITRALFHKPFGSSRDRSTYHKKLNSVCLHSTLTWVLWAPYIYLGPKTCGRNSSFSQYITLESIFLIWIIWKFISSIGGESFSNETVSRSRRSKIRK